MTAPKYFVFDGDPDADPPIPPRVPSVDDLGGAEFEDDAANPPDPLVFPSAHDWNQKTEVLAGLANTSFKLGIAVSFSGGTPSVSGFQQVGTRLTTGLLTVTDNGTAGDTTITWPADYLPPRNLGPLVCVNEDVEIDRVRAYLVNSGNGVRVKTKLGATGTDAGFTVWIP